MNETLGLGIGIAVIGLAIIMLATGIFLDNKASKRIEAQLQQLNAKKNAEALQALAEKDKLLQLINDNKRDIYGIMAEADKEIASEQAAQAKTTNDILRPAKAGGI